MEAFTVAERKMLQRLTTPAKIQDYLNALPFNHELDGDTCYSPKMVMNLQKAQCMEGAMFAAAALRMQGQPPLVLDLTSTKHDFDHVVAVFKQDGYFGAMSKTNHAVLRYREPIYKNIRELVLSYFHEYFLDDGRKTLRSYSQPINLSRFDTRGWMTSEEDVWFIPEYLADVKHTPLLTKKQVGALRLADNVEREAGKVIEWPKKSSVARKPRS